MYAAHVIHRYTIVIIVNKHFSRRDFILLTTTMAKKLFNIFNMIVHSYLFFTKSKIYFEIDKNRDRQHTNPKLCLKQILIIRYYNCNLLT